MTRKLESAQPRKGMPSPRLGEDEFKRRFFDQFQDMAFSSLQAELNKMADAAWDGYSHSRKSPRTRRAGEGYADPDYALAHAWINAADAVHAALRAHRDDAEHRILLINASPRSEHTCPGEMSKSYRLAQMARSVFLDEHARVDLLDLSRLSSEYGRQIHPCKACFSTSPALCHWPCSCYPNHSLGQVHDWMNEIYPRWVAAHGVMIHARQLVSDDVTSEIDDGSTGMCRWRKSGPNDDTWQRRCQGESD
jgi:NADPH-dependent FMN reductase